jgi:hypothetical protein
VLRCLQEAGAGLTAKQIKARISCASCSVEEALAQLVQLRMVVCLNTVIPSYSYRYPGPSVHAE